MKTDILIVGSGCAGLYAAIHLPADKKITIITKKWIDVDGTTLRPTDEDIMKMIRPLSIS